MARATTMTEFEIKRVVVACDAQGEIERALHEASALAARLRVPLHGVFLKDENLLRLAGLPFARALSLSSPDCSEAFASGDLEALLSALAARMRRALAMVAEEAGLDWSFAELRDVPSAASGVVEEGDMLVIEAGGPPVSDARRLRSPWRRSRPRSAEAFSCVAPRPPGAAAAFLSCCAPARMKSGSWAPRAASPARETKPSSCIRAKASRRAILRRSLRPMASPWPGSRWRRIGRTFGAASSGEGRISS